MEGEAGWRMATAFPQAGDTLELQFEAGSRTWNYARNAYPFVVHRVTRPTPGGPVWANCVCIDARDPQWRGYTKRINLRESGWRLLDAGGGVPAGVPLAEDAAGDESDAASEGGADESAEADAEDKRSADSQSAELSSSEPREQDRLEPVSDGIITRTDPVSGAEMTFWQFFLQYADEACEAWQVAGPSGDKSVCPRLSPIYLRK